MKGEITTYNCYSSKLDHRTRVKNFFNFGYIDRIPFVDWAGHPCFIDFKWKNERIIPSDADLFVMAGYDGSEGPCTEEIIDIENNKGHFYWPTRGLEWVNFNLHPIPEFKLKKWRDDKGYEYQIEPFSGGISKRLPPSEKNPYGGLTAFKAPVTTKDDWDEYKTHFNGKDINRYPHKAGVCEIKRYRETKQSVNLRMEGIWTRAMNTFGTEDFYYKIVDEPNFIEEVLDFYMDFSIDLATPALEKFQIDTASIVDGIGYEGGSWASKEMFKELLLPRYKKMVCKIREYGIRTVYFDCGGGIKNLIPYLISAGFEGTNYIPMSAGMNVVELKKEYGKDFILMGGIDRRIISFGTKDEIKNEIERVMSVVPVGGYLPYLDGGIYIETPIENYLYYAEILGKSLGAK